MSWRAFGETLSTADMSGTPVQFQPITPTRNRVIKAIRSTLVLFNDPLFTSAQMHIYAMNGSVLGDLLGASQARTKSSMHSLSHAIKSYYFEFETMPSLRSGVTYAIALKLNGYTGNDASHVAWVRELAPFMDHEVGTIENVNINEAPFSVEFVGDRF